MTLRMTAEEKSERAERRRTARVMAEKLAKAKECGRYIVCYNQAQLNAAITLTQDKDIFTPQLCTFLELRHGTFIINGMIPFEVDQLFISQGVTVSFKQVNIKETSLGVKITKIEDDDRC